VAKGKKEDRDLEMHKKGRANHKFEQDKIERGRPGYRWIQIW
jgi:hypothetical protein